MWPLPSIKSELVTISLSPESITCSWITRSTVHTPFHLKAYSHIQFTKLEYAQANIFHPTYLRQYIDQFLKQHNLHNAFVTMSIAGPSIIESTVELSKLSPESSDFPFPKLNTVLWDYRYLYPQDDRFAFYVCGMSRHLLAQHQLLAISIPINLIAITTARMALLRLYQQQYGVAFRHAQLGRDLHNHNNDMHALFSTDMIRRQLLIKPSLNLNVDEHQSSLLTALGLYLVGKDLHATN